jgi:hypothetical protein
MSITLGLIALAAFVYLIYRDLSKPNKTGTGGGGIKPDDNRDHPNKN